MQRELLLEALVASVTETIIVSDSKGMIVLANPRSHEIFGYEPDSLIGKCIEDLVPARFKNIHIQHRKSFYAKPANRMMGAGLELYAKRKNCTAFPAEISLSFFLENDQPYVVSFIVDVSKRKEAELALLFTKEELETKAEALKISNQELEEFTFISSHDFMEPLRMVTTYTQLLKEKFGHILGNEGNEFLSYAAEGATRISLMIWVCLKSTFSYTP